MHLSQNPIADVAVDMDFVILHVNRIDHLIQ